MRFKPLGINTESRPRQVGDPFRLLNTLSSYEVREVDMREVAELLDGKPRRSANGESPIESELP